MEKILLFILTEERTLADTAQTALELIADKNYNAELIVREIGAECIRHYGFVNEQIRT